MEKIVEAEYREMTDLSEKSIEQLASEANVLWSQMEMIGNIGLSMAAQAGRRLAVIKERLPHGRWEDWCDENLEFSKSKAAKMMKLAEKIEDQNSIFSNLETFPDLGISRVWALLSAPEEVAEQIVNDPQTEELTVRELKEEIRRLTDEKRESEQTGREKIKQLEIRTSELESLKQEKSALEEKLEKEKEKIQKIKTSQSAELEKAVSDAVEKAKEEVKEKVSKENEEFKKRYEEAQQIIEKLKHSENKSLAIFKVKADLLQDTFNGCIDSIKEIESQSAEQADKLKAALKQLLTLLLERI